MLSFLEYSRGRSIGHCPLSYGFIFLSSTMWKGGAARTLSRSIFRPATSIPQPRIVGIASRLHTLTSGAPLSFKASPTLALALRKPTTTALLRYASTTSIDTGREQKIGHKELKPHPEEVSTGSSVRHIIHDEGGTPIEKQEPKVSAGLSGDLVRGSHVCVSRPVALTMLHSQ